jgi:hypothetical protein
VKHPSKGLTFSPFFRVNLFVRKLVHPSKRVNGRVLRVNNPSKGEWGFSKYTLAKIPAKKTKTSLKNKISTNKIVIGL